MSISNARKSKKIGKIMQQVATADAARRRRRQEIHRRWRVERKLAAANFIPLPPLRVEEFTGGEIPRGKIVTDVHIVDRRGRTVCIFAPRSGHTRTLKERRERAEWYVPLMNELLAERIAALTPEQRRRLLVLVEEEDDEITCLPGGVRA